MAAKSRRPAGGKRAAAEEATPVSIDKLALVRRMIARYSASLDEKGPMKTAVSDLIRLLALEKELAEEQAFQEIKVRWVDSHETESAA
jgi:hypothetical protein